MLDLLLVAVKPEYQNKGVNALLFSDLIPVYQKLVLHREKSHYEFIRTFPVSTDKNREYNRISVKTVKEIYPEENDLRRKEFWYDLGYSELPVFSS